MSRRRRQKTSNGNLSSGDIDHNPSQGHWDGDRPQRWLPMFVGVLLVVRYFLPAESASLGETLWVVQLWLMGAVVWFWLTARSEFQWRRIDALDLAVALLVGGHLLSGGLVLGTEGDRRAALNMMWEWAGIGVSILMIRDVVCWERGRQQLLTTVIFSAVTLSGLGLWQHHVWYPSLTHKFAEYEQLLSTVPEDASSAQRRTERLRILQRELGPLVTGDDESGQLFRARVAGSSEPIGRFALANTFAGLLLVGLILAAAQLVHGGSPPAARWRWFAAALLTIGSTYCFWLTKSRTAYVALLVGLGIWFVIARGGRRAGTGLRWLGLAAVTMLILLPIVASLAGGLDRQVITEAPKSLQYRLEYWTATGEVIRQSPIFGVGPGNFRQAYLVHKLPGSSEEVLDPHNLFLDVWANGGLLALAGLLWVTGLIVRRAWQLAAGGPDSQQTTETSAPFGVNLPPATVFSDLAVGIGALGLAAFVSLMSGSGFIDSWWWLAAGWSAVCLVWPKQRSVRCAAIAAAGVALLVHLMGAGGIAMPAILQTLLLLAACLLVVPVPSAGRGKQNEWVALPPPLPWQPMLGAGICLCLSIACAFTATLPVSMARTQTTLGQAILAEGGRAEQAMSALESAIEADPLAAEPWQALALAHVRSWQRLAGQDSSSFDAAIAAQQEAIRLDPLASARWQLLGELWWMRYRDTVDPLAATEAMSAFEQATGRYPHQARLQAQLAEAASAAGQAQAAVVAAGHALSLDAANRSAGHADKYLPEQTRQALEAIVSPAPPGQEAPR